MKERQAKLNNFLIAQNIIKLLIVSLIALNIYISSYQLLTCFRFARKKRARAFRALQGARGWYT
ncbi:hypothetical protein [Lactococcus lactis]|uniref:hypothetical protein n=1 Tax=Lactococcus lactis TaxID=1358 RepID=UPI00223C0BBC|nr:hypothetical protein [Lactococcus lactis]